LWLGPLLISLFGKVSQNGVLTDVRENLNLWWRRLGGAGGREEPRLGAVMSEPRYSLNVLRCSGIAAISVFRGRTPKARRETFMTTETSLGKPGRAPEGHLKLVPRPWDCGTNPVREGSGKPMGQNGVLTAYLVQPPVLVPPTPGCPFVLYLTVRRQSLGCMLGQEEESTHTERAIYYMSKKFTDGESNYPEIEKMCCALLTEYDIEYVSRTSVKGQAIVDHLAEFPIEDRTPINLDFPDEGILQVDDEGEKLGCKMYFEGAVNSTGSGIGAVLISPDGRYYPVALNFIDEKRLKELCRGQCYQQRMARAFNARVRHRDFSPGDLVLRKVLHVTPDSRGKFSYKYDGPFVVKEVFSGGVVILSDMDGTENALPVNADPFKKYYP
ncbi:hypothetical protein CRG98_035032, partial [Punica granatum]